MPLLFADAHLPVTASVKDLDKTAQHNTSLLCFEALYMPLPNLTMAYLQTLDDFGLQVSEDMYEAALRDIMEHLMSDWQDHV